MMGELPEMAGRLGGEGSRCSREGGKQTENLGKRRRGQEELQKTNRKLTEKNKNITSAGLALGTTEGVKGDSNGSLQDRVRVWRSIMKVKVQDRTTSWRGSGQAREPGCSRGGNRRGKGTSRNDEGVLSYPFLQGKRDSFGIWGGHGGFGGVRGEWSTGDG